MFDLHRHDEFSTFDGFGKAKELAPLAKELGHTALSTTNHGNTNGLIQTYKACKDVGIKAILGVEGYFLPIYKPQIRGFHLIVIAKNLKGYGNMNRLQYDGEKQKYYNPIWDFSLLEKYHEGLICTSACIAGYLSQSILKNEFEKADKFIDKMVSIFHDDFYIEIQPYSIDEKLTQEKVNAELMRLANKHHVKCILTSDSHRGRKEDFDSYLKMHEIAGHDLKWIEQTYKERYMPTEKEIYNRFVLMHEKDFDSKDEVLSFGKQMLKNISEIDGKCELNYLDNLELKLPKLSLGNLKSKGDLIGKVKEGLKKRGKYTKEYIDRCKKELDVVFYHGFEDYFLIVADYVNWAKSHDIAVGPGRGSVCNSVLAYALGITEVDSLYFKLDFSRFLRKDKKKFPDIDLDFETSRRHEVIEYLCTKYAGHSARIASYGLYKVDNLLNDLAKACGLETDKNIDDEQAKVNKGVVKQLKLFVKEYYNVDVDEINSDEMKSNPDYDSYNAKYSNILKHFLSLFHKVKYIGTHAAGVAITGGNLLDYTSIRIDKNGDIYTTYDLNDIEDIKVIKFDILGLRTMEEIHDLRRMTGVTVNYEKASQDKEIFECVREGNTDGIFQFDGPVAKSIANQIDCDCFEDVVAVNAMNRPGPLMQKMPAQYAANKSDISMAKTKVYWPYTMDTYGTIIYQEQLIAISTKIAKMSMEDADKILKMIKSGKADAKKLSLEAVKGEGSLHDKFVKGCLSNGFTQEQANELAENILVYSFNKGHAVGYSLISIEEIYYKLHYPTEYWYSKMKYAKDEDTFYKYCISAVHDGAVVFLPHVNLSRPKTCIRKVEGESAIQQGLSDINGIGEKASNCILEERLKGGIFTSYDDFYDRCKSRLVTSRVVDILKEQGALEFNKKTFLSRVTKYNSALMMKYKR